MARTATASRSARTAGAATRTGTNGFAHAQVAEIQRARILSAMFDVACELGAGSVSVADVVERSGVSRRTFYELFDDREDCFLAAFEDALGLARARVLPAYAAGVRWRERIRAALVALLSFLDEEPRIGRLLICESPASDARTLARRGEVVAQLTRAVDAGRGESATASPPPLTAEGLVGGVLALLHARLEQREREPLIGLVNPLMSMIVLPYLGQAAARRELERAAPVPVGDVSAERLRSDPFKEAGMRLTYRTVRVLLTIAELGERGIDPSNRLVGDGAGISDQGQISKLLGRLSRIGLVANTGLGHGLGAPNAWSLTAKGRQLADSIRAHTEGST